MRQNKTEKENKKGGATEREIQTHREGFGKVRAEVYDCKHQWMQRGIRGKGSRDSLFGNVVCFQVQSK